MDIDINQLRDQCSKLRNTLEEINTTAFTRCVFKGLNSSLVSLESHFAQINDLATGEHGLTQLVNWHIKEGECVYQALEIQCQNICRTDAATRCDLTGHYDHIAGEDNHQSCLPENTSGLGHEQKLSDGRTVRYFSNNGSSLAEEPLDQNIDQLAVAFAKFDSGVFADCADAWTSAGETLVTLADDVQKIANDVQGAGSKDAYTYEAGTGIRRWVASLRQLGKQADTVSKHIDTFAKNYDHARTEVNALADESDRAKLNATEEHPYNPAVYTEKANAVLRDHYNPGLAHADTKSVEIPVPIRAFHRDDTVRLPEPSQAAPVAPSGVLISRLFRPTLVSCSQHLAIPLPASRLFRRRTLVTFMRSPHQLVCLRQRLNPTLLILLSPEKERA